MKKLANWFKRSHQMKQPQDYELPETFEFRYPPDVEYRGKNLYPCCICGEKHTGMSLRIHWPTLRLVEELFPASCNVCNHLVCRPCYGKEPMHVMTYWCRLV